MPPTATKPLYGTRTHSASDSRGRRVLCFPCTCRLSASAQLQGALRGATLVICSGAVSALSKAMQVYARGLDNVVLLSAAGISRGVKADGGLFGLFSADVAERKALLSEKREAKVASCGLPYTIVRVPAFNVRPSDPPSL